MQDGTEYKIIFFVFLALACYIILTLPAGNSRISDSHKSETKNQSMTNNDPSYNWGWSDDYCLRKLIFKNGSIIQIPRCEF